MSKILFLDFDGVLNPELYCNHLAKIWKYSNGICKSRDQFGDYFAPWCVDELKNIINFTGCDIVISSTWRTHMDVKHLWKTRELPGNCVGATPHLLTERGLEVYSWMLSNGFPEKYAILDDIDEFTKIKSIDSSKFIKTDSRYGLTRSESEKVINLLI